MFQKLARLFFENSKKITIIFISMTCFFAYQLFHLNVDFTPQKMFNKADPDYKFYSEFIDEFGKDLFKSPEFINKLIKLQKAIEEDPLVGKTLSVADIVFQMHGAFIAEGQSNNTTPLLKQDIDDYLFMVEDETERLVNQDFSWGIIDVRCKSVDSDIISSHFKRTNHLIQKIFSEKDDHIAINVSGISVFAYKSIDNLIEDMVKSIFMASLIVFMVIAFEFKSLQIAFVSMIPNIIPVLFSYGIMGWLGVKLELTTVIVFTIALGLAVDDSIHFLVRFREEFEKDGHYENAIQRAFNGVGRAIVYTTVILVSGLIVLTVSSLPPMVRFALLTAATMMSALIADLFILPACIVIFKPRFRTQNNAVEKEIKYA